MTFLVPVEGMAQYALRERHLAFAEAILDPDRPVPSGFIGPDGEPSARRFAVYRNNVVFGLCETLKAAFPAVQRIVGHEFFAAMARVYISSDPPCSPIMLDYGAGFADFIGAFEPVAALPYLPDVARLERAWVEAYHAAEATPADPAALGRIAPTQLPHMRLVLHPSTRVVRSSFPAVTIWHMNTDRGVPAAVDIDHGGEDALITRPAAEVAVRALPAGAAAFVQALAAGTPITGAVTLALADDPRFDLAGALRGLLEAQVIVGWSPADDPPDPVSGRSA